MLSGNLDDIIERRIAYDGVWEAHIITHILASLAPSSLFIDVGANIGSISIPVAKKAAKTGLHVISIEANPHMAQRLRHNVRLNRLDNITVVDKCASDEKGKSRFSQTLPGTPNQGLSGMQTDRQIAGSITNEIDTITVDEIIADLNLDNRPVSVIKVDVEGAELKVLRGCGKTIEKFLPVLFFEYHEMHHSDDPENGKALQGFLAEQGYRIFSLSDKKYHFLPGADLRVPFSGDLMAVPFDKPDITGDVK
jgi:FkbM family methyltransferase